MRTDKLINYWRLYINALKWILKELIMRMCMGMRWLNILC